MPARNPLVLVNGAMRELPQGESIVGAPVLRAYLSDGTRIFIALDGRGELLAQRSDGTATALPTTGVIHG